MDAVMTKRLLAAGLAVLAVVAGGCDRPAGGGPGPGTTSTARAAPPTTAPPPTTVDPAVASWPVHASRTGGFRLRYPPGWRVKESTGSGGTALSLLPRRGAGISVLATATPPPGTGAGPPEDQCQPVRIGRLEGTRCLDSVAMVVTTTLQGGERWFVLTTSLRRPARPAGAYDGVLSSFRLA